MDSNNRNYSKIPFAGLGLVFGTGVGLVIGAAIDSMKKRE